MTEKHKKIDQEKDRKLIKYVDRLVRRVALRGRKNDDNNIEWTKNGIQHVLKRDCNYVVGKQCDYSELQITVSSNRFIVIQIGDYSVRLFENGIQTQEYFSYEELKAQIQNEKEDKNGKTFKRALSLLMLVFSAWFSYPEYVPGRFGVSASIYEARTELVYAMNNMFMGSTREEQLGQLEEFGVFIIDENIQEIMKTEGYQNLVKLLENWGFFVSEMSQFSSSELAVIIEVLATLPHQWFTQENLGDISFGKIHSSQLNGIYLGASYSSYSGDFNTKNRLFLFEASTIDLSMFGETVTRMCIVHELIHGLVEDDLSEYLNYLSNHLSAVSFDENRLVFTNRADIINSYLRYGNTNIDEFLAVSGSIYTFGYDSFMYVYTPFIGPEDANTLYQFLREKVFYGLEYETGWKERLFQHSPHDAFVLLKGFTDMVQRIK